VGLVVEGPEVLHQPDVAVLLHDGKDGAVVAAFFRLYDSEFEPFEHMSFNLFLVCIWSFKLLDIDGLRGFKSDLMH